MKRHVKQMETWRMQMVTEDKYLRLLTFRVLEAECEAQMKRRNQSTLKQWFSNLMDFKKVKLKKWLELE